MMRRLDVMGFKQHETPRSTNRAVGTIEDRGVALIVTLLLLFLVSALGLAAVLSSSSDLMINGYYGNYRGSFYAADSGLNMARQSMQTYILGLVPNGTVWQTTWTTCTVGNPQPIVASSVSWSNPYSSSTPLTGAGATNPATVQNSWAESFQITSSTLLIPTTGGCTPVMTGIGAPYYTYTFNYTLTSVGTASGSEQASVSENGSFVVTISATGGQKPANTSFSAFGAFINSFPPCYGPLVYGTLSGPLYAASTTGCAQGVSNCGEWNLGSGGSYTFTYPVNETGSAFSYYVGNSCTQSANVPFKSGNTTISPTFEASYHLNQSVVGLPGNDYSQRWAVLDGLGCGENNGNECGNLSTPSPNLPTAQQMNQYSMQNANQNNAAANPYATVSGSTYTPATSGVFIPYTCSGSTCTLSPTAGGIYVEDSSGAATTLTLTAATSGMYTASTFPTSSQCTAATCQVIQVAQAGNSTTGSSTIGQQGSTSCNTNSQQTWSGGHWVTTYTTTCTANFTQSTPTNTPTTITNITTDPTSNVTTAQTYVQTATSTVTTPTVANTCTVSGQSGCTVSTPSSSSFSSCSGWNNNCTTTNSSTNGQATDLTLAGVPTMSASLGTPTTTSCTSAASGACAETMIYVDGSTNITGPSSGAAVQNNSMMTVVANGNIQQTGNLTYATEPVTTSGSNIDSLATLPANASYQVLGLYTASGEFQLNPSSNGGNIETDAAIAVISGSSSCTRSNNCGMIATPGNSVGTWTNVGGRSENYINGVSINTGNVYYDQRFATWNSFGPPWFPETVIATQDVTLHQTTASYPTVQRVQWYSSSGGQ